MLAILFVITLDDLLNRRIRNNLVLFIFILAIFISPLESILLSIVISSFVSLALFTTQLWAGGDSKLFIALAPLFPPSQLLDFFVSMLLCGGVIAVFYLVKYRYILKSSYDRGLPYGIAIVCGANLSLYFSKGLEIYS
ncbi:prepilin peptidase [Vibrio breoganii]